MSAICVIDDDIPTRIAIEMVLQREGFFVRAFSSAREFFNAGALDDIGCILTDIEMPGGVTGLDLLAEVTKNPSCCPVVVMTGRGDGAYRSAARALGACDYLEKPFSARTLVKALSKAMPTASGVMAAE
jgi:FixJ family two-component response regulator